MKRIFGAILSAVVLFAATGILVGSLNIQPAGSFAANTQYRWVKAVQAGFGNAQNGNIPALGEFNGIMYAGTTNSDGQPELWKSPTGSVWTKGNAPGAGTGQQYDAILGLSVFGGKLYAGTGWANGLIWRSANGADWELITDEDFGDTIAVPSFITYNSKLYAARFDGIFVSDTGNTNDWDLSLAPGGVVFSMGTFNNQLYAGVSKSDTSTQVYRYDEINGWDPVSEIGFGDVNNVQAGGFAVLNGEMYSGTRNDVTGSEIWKTANGTTWSYVMKGGFGDVNNNNVEGIINYHGKLYASQDNATTGLQVWSSTNGTDWVREKDSRYDPPLNTWSTWNNSLLIFKDRLFMSTENVTRGGEIWVYPGYQSYLPISKK